MKKFIISAAVIFALFFGNAIYAQPEPPDHGQGTNQPPPGGGGAPIGEGIAILTVMGVAYGYRKLMSLKSEE
jgi:hypothetical protein